ncbi:MAG: OmpA family protein [Luteibaculaceae bacterium]
MQNLKFSLTLLATFLLLSFSAVAQKKITREADKEFKNQGYHNAIEMYKKAFSVEPKASEKARIVFQIAECYREVNDWNNALEWYQRAFRAKYDEPKIFLRLGQAYMNQAKYPEAIIEFNKYLDAEPNDKKARKALEACELAQSWMDKPTRYVVQPEVMLNSRSYDFSPVFTDAKQNELIFVSGREGSTGSKTDPRSGSNFMDLYSAERDRKGKWSEPQLLGETINTEHNEGPVSLDLRGKTLYFTRCITDKKKMRGCDIFVASKSGKDWGEPEALKLKPEGADSLVVAHPSLSSDGQRLFFAANLPGGKGGTDIWYVDYNRKDKKWGTPVNLGNEVNTPGNEQFPFIHSNGNLYFSSDFHPGLGGLDIFVATKVGEDKWGSVENLQYPINSPYDDFGIIFESAADRGYFSSNRDGGMGKDDIYSFNLPPMLFALQGLVYDKDTKEPVIDATISVAGTDGASFQAQTDEDGSFAFIENNGERFIKADNNYSIIVTKPDYLVAKDQISTKGLSESTTFIKEFFITFTSPDIAIEFPEVRYDLGKAALQVNDQVNSKDSLNFLYQILLDNPTIIIELQAHTDTRGSAESNQKLSQARAQSCVDYLVSKGINPARMVAKGYGENKPKISDAQIAKMTTREEQEAAHQKNRRTEFSVLSFDFVPPSDAEQP